MENDVPYEAPKGKIWKTNGNSEYVLIDDPDMFSLEGRKIRKKNTHLTPKKKKRKKH